MRQRKRLGGLVFLPARRVEGVWGPQAEMYKPRPHPPPPLSPPHTHSLLNVQLVCVKLCEEDEREEVVGRDAQVRCD